jgi:hypothetical protein
MRERGTHGARRAVGATVLAVVLVVATTGCASEPDQGQDEEEIIDTPSTPESPPPGESSPEQQAAADLAGRLGIPEEEVEVVSVEEITWRDGSLGCAEPGMQYTQALVDGIRIVLEAAGSSYEYHAGGSTPPFLCENPTE